MSFSDEWYRDWFGEDYLKVYPHRDQQEAVAQVAFVEKVLPLSPGAAVLDLGCGNGRHARELSRRGYEVTCLDLSSVLLKMAHKKGTHTGCCPRFVQADMRRLPFRSTFDAVMSFFTTFGYFESDSENLKTLLAIRDVLRPGGFFMQDYMNRDYVLGHLVPQDVRRENGYEVVQERRYDEQRRRIEKKIKLVEGEKQRHYFESVRLYSLAEMKTLLSRAGLVVDHAYGDFDGSPFAADSPRLILAGHKGKQ